MIFLHFLPFSYLFEIHQLTLEILKVLFQYSHKSDPQKDLSYHHLIILIFVLYLLNLCIIPILTYHSFTYINQINCMLGLLLLIHSSFSHGLDSNIHIDFLNSPSQKLMPFLTDKINLLKNNIHDFVYIHLLDKNKQNYY